MSGKHTVVYVHGKSGSADEAEHYMNIVIWSLVYHFFSIHSRHGLFGGYYF